MFLYNLYKIQFSFFFQYSTSVQWLIHFTKQFVKYAIFHSNHTIQIINPTLTKAQIEKLKAKCWFEGLKV